MGLRFRERQGQDCSFNRSTLPKGGLDSRVSPAKLPKSLLRNLRIVLLARDLQELGGENLVALGQPDARSIVPRSMSARLPKGMLVAAKAGVGLRFPVTEGGRSLTVIV